MAIELPVDIIKNIASFLPPSSAYVHLLCLSHEIYELLLPLLWTELEIDHTQLHSLLLAFHSPALDASPNPHHTPPVPSSRDRLRTPWNQNTQTLWTPPAPSGASILHRSRLPLRNPWNITRYITLWSPANIDTAHVILPFLDELSPSHIFPSLQSLKVPFALLNTLAPDSIPRSYNLTKQREKVQQTLVRVFRPSTLVVLGMEHFPQQSLDAIRKPNLENGPILWDWVANLKDDWLCLKEVIWDGVGIHQLCFISGIRNVVRMAAGSSKDAMERQGRTDFLTRLHGVLDLCWGGGRTPFLGIRDTIVVWKGPYPPRGEIEELEKEIARSHELSSSFGMRDALVKVVDGVARLKCFEYDYEEPPPVTDDQTPSAD